VGHELKQHNGIWVRKLRILGGIRKSRRNRYAAINMTSNNEVEKDP
jgi:hypothetical protein